MNSLSSSIFLGGTSLSGLWSATGWRIGTGVLRMHSTQRLVIGVQVWVFIPFGSATWSGEVCSIWNCWLTRCTLFFAWVKFKKPIFVLFVFRVLSMALFQFRKWEERETVRFFGLRFGSEFYGFFFLISKLKEWVGWIKQVKTD